MISNLTKGKNSDYLGRGYVNKKLNIAIDLILIGISTDYGLGFPAGLSRPGKSREGPGTGRDRTGPRDLEGPVVLAGQDLETLKVPGLF